MNKKYFKYGIGLVLMFLLLVFIRDLTMKSKVSNEEGIVQKNSLRHKKNKHLFEKSSKNITPFNLIRLIELLPNPPLKIHFIGRKKNKRIEIPLRMKLHQKGNPSSPSVQMNLMQKKIKRIKKNREKTKSLLALLKKPNPKVIKADIQLSNPKNKKSLDTLSARRMSKKLNNENRSLKAMKEKSITNNNMNMAGSEDNTTLSTNRDQLKKDYIASNKTKNKSKSTASAPVSGIPIGFDQIQNRLSSYVKKKNKNHNIAVNNTQQLVVDNTHTNIGEEFFTTFNNLWNPPKSNTDYVISITEKPLPSMGTMIVVLVNNSVAFQTKLNPNSKYINEICREAIKYVWQKLKNQESISY